MLENQTDVGFNEQALLKAITVSNPIDSIRTYIELISKQDSQLKESLIDESKSYENCWEYIQNKAKQYLNSKSGHIPPQTIFGWAIHYFTESSDVINKEFTSIHQAPHKVLTRIEPSNESASDKLSRIMNRLNSVKVESDE